LMRKKKKEKEMKTLYGMGLCLLLAGNGVAQNYETYENYPDEAIAYIRERFKNSENLKASLMGNFTYDHFLWPEEVPLYMKTFGITEDTLRVALMGVIEESTEVTKWEPLRRDVQDELLSEKRRLMHSITWLRFCADKPTKEFLMEIAVDETKGEVYRNMAVGAYIKSADARQIKDALIRFLTEKRVVVYSTYLYAIAAYEEAGDDAAKRVAIVEALTAAALLKEEDRGYFAMADKDIAEQDKEYAKSPRRKAAFQLMNLPLPPEPKEQKKAWWKKQ